MGRGTQRYAEVSRCMQRYARSCIEQCPSAYRHTQMNTDTLVFTIEDGNVICLLRQPAPWRENKGITFFAVVRTISEFCLAVVRAFCG